MNIKEKITKPEKELAEIKKELNSNWTKFTFQGKEYEISENLGEMPWEDAVQECNKLGGQLPPRWLLCAIADEPELASIKKIFEAGDYWSSSEYSATGARYGYFASGSVYTSGKTLTSFVRCVKGW
jgi:hypothetical protein